MKKVNIIVIGPPGAGKGTQSERISGELGIPHISTGDMLRQHSDLETEHGMARDYMDRGDLVPDKIVYSILDHRLKKRDTENGFVLDGFPRDISQARHLESMEKIDVVISLEVDKNNVIRRLTGRRICDSCGKTFHLDYKPPVKEGVCDKCGSDLVQREDDKKDVIEQRLKKYRDKTLPLKEFYRKKGVLRKVDGNKDIEAVWNDIKEMIEEFLR